MASQETSADGIEKIIGDLSQHLVASLNSLGCQRYGIDQDDLLQEIRVKIWQAYEAKNSDIQYFNAYVKKIISSVFINEINRINKEKRALALGANVLDHDNGGNGHGSRQNGALRDRLMASLDDLQESKRRVIQLNMEGFTFGEIACLNNWSYRKTCLTFYRGIRELKEILAQEGIDYED